MCPKFRRNERLISVKDKINSSLHKVQTGSKTQPSYHQFAGDLSSEVKQMGREADSSTESSAGVKNALKCTSTTPSASFIARRSVKQRIDSDLHPQAVVSFVYQS